MADLSNLRKRRSTVKGSITKLFNRVKMLESKAHEALTLDLANQTWNLLTNNSKHSTFPIDESDAGFLAKEQEVLDKHDDEIAEISLRITQLVRNCNIASDSGMRKVLSRRLIDLETRLKMVESASESLTSSPEHVHLLHQYHDQLNDFKTELFSTSSPSLTKGYLTSC